MGVPMIFPKVIVKCYDLPAKKHFKKDNPLRKGGRVPNAEEVGLFKIGG